MEQIDPGKAYLLLESGPVVLVTTRDGDRANIMTMGFHMVLQHAPPMIGCVVGPWDYSYKALKETGECVIAVPTVDLAHKVVKFGNCTSAKSL
jgi:flavin reductase (DIM6/NTAB) family NADH-FMN oxidoreductase RutF